QSFSSVLAGAAVPPPRGSPATGVPTMRSLLASIHPVSHCGAVNALSVAGQRGQAMMEGLLILMLLALLWVAVAWLGHLQDMALSAQHASRHVAFLLTRKPADDMLGPVLQQHFTGPAHQWSDRRGKPMLGGHGSVQHDTDRQSVLAQAAQPGGDDPSAGSLRRSWGLQDEGILTAKVRVTPQSWANLSARGNFASGLNDFNKYPVLHRHTAILTG